MRFSVAAAALVSAAVGVKATNYTVLVGANSNLTFEPTSLSGVNQGDMIAFQFVSKNHSVTQSTFAAPCTAAGVDSGFQAVANTTTDSFPTWSFTVENASAPLWFFCAQTTPAVHCQAGMVFAINPTQAKSFDAFKAAAIATNATSPTGQNPSGSAISGTAGATDGAVSVAGSSAAASATAAASGSGSGSGSGSSSGSSASPSGTSAANNGAAQLTGSSISLLAVAGLLAGLAL